MISNKVSFKKFYSLFTITSFLFVSTALFIPKEVSAQAYVPVKDAELISAFKLFLESSVGYSGGGTYIVDGNPVEIAATECSTTTLPGSYETIDGNEVWNSGKKSYFNYDINKNGVVDPSEEGVYKEDWVRDSDGNWNFKNISQGGDVYYTRDRIDAGIRDPKQEDPSADDYYTDPKNPYFFLPNYDEMQSTAGINNSTSLNCLLQENIEWQKLQINMQMHSMVKEYFTDAQTYALSQQLLSTLAAATIEWSNKGLEQTTYVDGVAVTTTGSVYENSSKIAAGRESSIASLMSDQITGGTVSSNDLELNLNPQESKMINESIKSLSPEKNTGFNALKEKVTYTSLPAGSTPSEIYANSVTNSALNVTGILENETLKQMEQAAAKEKEQWMAYGGYLPQVECRNDDPFCVDPQIVTPGNILGQNLYEATQSGNNALRASDELGENTGTSSQELSYQLQQKSLADYDVQQLLNNKQTPRELFNEFEFVLTNYYGVNEGTTAWSRNMLVNTWDDIMWGSGAAGKAEELGKRLEEIKTTVDNYGTVAP